jgi:hypothetical protein
MNSLAEDQCPICRGNAQIQSEARHDAVRVACPRCSPSGRCVVTGRWLRTIEASDDDLRPYLSIYVRRATDRGEQVTLGTENWRDFARAETTTRLDQKLRRMLELVATDAGYQIGEQGNVDLGVDYPAVGAISSAELTELALYLKDQGLLTFEPGHAFKLTIDGWRTLEPQLGRGIPGRCFVAMAFDPSLDDAWTQGFYLALKTDCECDPVRIDLVEHNEKICDRIIAEIRRAQFVVADFTLHRQNVYFEAGFAMALERDVIWTCRENEFTKDKQHFDTRQYPHILWKDPGDLRSQLANKIRARILKA